MLPALWVSKTGLSAQDTNLTTIANNLANVTTTGFKKDRAEFSDLLYQIKRQPGANADAQHILPSGLQLGTGVRIVGTQKNFAAGNLETTNQPLDLAIDGRGFFQISLPDGNIAYTRAGNFHLNEQGQFVTAGGLLLEPNISLDEGVKSFTIGKDGTVSATYLNGGDAQIIANLTLADFINPQGLEAIGENLFLETAASGSPNIGTPGFDGRGKLLQNTLEGSNVSVVEELVSMISTQRAYEINSKVISSADQMLGFLAQNL